MENKQLRRAVASLPCVSCGIEGYSQCAHSNEYSHGKGRGMKSSDAATFPLCCDRVGIVGCHSRWDQHDVYMLDLGETELDKSNMWIANTYKKLMELGYLKVTYKG